VGLRVSLQSAPGDVLNSVERSCCCLRRTPLDSPSPDKGATRVLVADDEHMIADTLRVILGRSGYDVGTAYNGIMAVEAARLWSPDIFLSDVIMPDMNGIDAAIRIRLIVPTCKILLFSGAANLRDLVEEARRSGHYFEILAKPIHPTRLLERLRGL
jgi:CheY-like chemotaxis protein